MKGLCPSHFASVLQKGLIEPMNYLEACSGYAEAQSRKLSAAVIVATIISGLVLVLSLIVTVVVVMKWKKKTTQERRTTELKVELMGDF